MQTESEDSLSLEGIDEGNIDNYLKSECDDTPVQDLRVPILI